MRSTETKVALVTGGSRSIGRAISLRLAQDGFNVIINYRESIAAAQQLRDEIAKRGFPEAVAIQADVSELAETKRLFLEIKKRYEGLSVLVNNAGIRADKLFLLSDDETWWHVMQTNLGSTVNCCRLALPLMLPQKSGCIINMSSISGLRGVQGQTAYSASKAAIIGFSKALAREVSRYNITINCIAPGLIDTESTRGLGEKLINERMTITPVQRLGTPEEVAEVVALLANGHVGYLFGQTIAIDGGVTM